jgi:hypothetical protein
MAEGAEESNSILGILPQSSPQKEFISEGNFLSPIQTKICPPTPQRDLQAPQTEDSSCLGYLKESPSGQKGRQGQISALLKENEELKHLLFVKELKIKDLENVLHTKSFDNSTHVSVEIKKLEGELNEKKRLIEEITKEDQHTLRRQAEDLQRLVHSSQASVSALKNKVESLEKEKTELQSQKRLQEDFSAHEIDNLRKEVKSLTDQQTRSKLLKSVEFESQPGNEQVSKLNALFESEKALLVNTIDQLRHQTKQLTLQVEAQVRELADLKSKEKQKPNGDSDSILDRGDLILGERRLTERKERREGETGSEAELAALRRENEQLRRELQGKAQDVKRLMKATKSQVYGEDNGSKSVDNDEGNKKRSQARSVHEGEPHTKNSKELSLFEETGGKREEKTISQRVQGK